MRDHDTIVALASGAGRAGVAVIRASGPHVAAALPALVGDCPPVRLASLRRLRNPGSGEVLDETLVLRFAAPASFTGEDVVEFHIHGGRAGVAAVLETLSGQPGWRIAEPGEFTRRAVAHGRMDLTAAEGLADLVAAETGSQRRQALHQAGGALERAAMEWRGRLLRALALLEAEIDFPDEDDVPVLAGRVRTELQAVATDLRAALADARAGERLREGATIVIAGPPNAGKSTLLNALAQREVAIVSALPGTTRDLIEVSLDLGGWPVTLVDTAGLREATDPVERIGVERARRRAADADHVLWLSPADAPLPCPPELQGATEVITKADLLAGGHDGNPAALAVSAATGRNLAAVLGRLAVIARAVLEPGEAALVTRARHRQELGAVLDALDRTAAIPEPPVELAAEDLRLALRALGRLTGAVDIDEIYDVVFREFCIGK